MQSRLCASLGIEGQPKFMSTKSLLEIGGILSKRITSQQEVNRVGKHNRMKRRRQDTKTHAATTTETTTTPKPTQVPAPHPTRVTRH